MIFFGPSPMLPEPSTTDTGTNDAPSMGASPGSESFLRPPISQSIGCVSLCTMENAANDDLVRADPVEDDVFTVHELVRAALINPSHVGIVAQNLENGVEFAQVFFGLSVTESLDGVAIDIFQVAFGALCNSMTHAEIRRGLPE